MGSGAARAGLAAAAVMARQATAAAHVHLGEDRLEELDFNWGPGWRRDDGGDSHDGDAAVAPGQQQTHCQLSSASALVGANSDSVSNSDSTSSMLSGGAATIVSA